jgi:hypothetical protein
MNERLYWGILVVAAAVACVLLGVLKRYFTMRAILSSRTMLHREKMTALSKGVDLPKEDQNIVLNGRAFGFVTFPFRKLATLSGLVLFLGGLGTLLAFVVSEKANLKSLASLALIPTFVGLGLALYPVALKKYIEKP